MVTKQLNLILVLAGGVMSAGGAVADTLQCPPSITTQERLADPAPEGWQAQTDAAPHYLAGINFFDGPPIENRSLAPNRDVRSGKQRKATWQFGQHTEPVWLSCRYLDSAITLSQALPARYTECELTYGAGGVVAGIRCK